MKKIVPFKKEINLFDDYEEIVSIEITHNYKKEDSKILGEFTINGEYKNSKEILPFKYDIPFQINLDDKYLLDDIEVSIDDFYYETVDKKLIVNIELLVDKLKERCIEEEDLFKEEENTIMVEKEDNNLDNNVDNNDTYTTYKVYIVEDSDTIESICSKYNITKEELEKYNDLENIKTKDKIIIPYLFNENIK